MRPRLVAVAPVKAPRSWPKNSDSKSVSGSAAQLTAIIGAALRAERAWMKRASTSLPVPDSPVMMTVESARAAVSASATKPLHRRALVDGRGRLVVRGRAHDGVAQRDVLPDEAALLVGLADDGLDLVERGGLRQVVVSAEPHRLDAGRERRVGGEHDDFGRLFEAADRAQRVEARHPRHADVEEHHVEVALRERVQSLLARRRRGRVEPHPPDLIRHEPAQHRVVVNHHHANLAAHIISDE